MSKDRKPATIGVLALQGDFDAHRKRLEELGAEVLLVKKPEQLDEIDGLVIPGGESGTFLKLLGEAGFEKLKQFALCQTHVRNLRGRHPAGQGSGESKAGGTRRARHRNPPQRLRPPGGQLDPPGRSKTSGESPIEMVFIRAPRIERIGPGVEVIATEGNDPVAVRQGKAMAATFHPELSEDTRVHRAFLDLVNNGREK